MSNHTRSLSHTRSAHPTSSPASFDHQQQQQPVARGYIQSHQPQLTPSYEEQQQHGEPQYFRRSSFSDPNGFSPSAVASFQPHSHQPQQFYDPSAHPRQSNPTYFTDMRLSSSHSTSSTASSTLSEQQWTGPVYEESPFVHHPPEDHLFAAASMIGTPGSYTSELLPLPALDPLSLHDQDAHELQAQQHQQFQQRSQSQQQYFQQQQQQGPYSSGDFSTSSEHLNGSVNGSPLVSPPQRQGSGYTNNGGPQHPYGSMGPADSSTSLHSIHSQQSLHSQASHHSLHGQYQQQQPPPQHSQQHYPGQQSPFPGLTSLAGVLPGSANSPIPGLSSSTSGLGGSGSSMGNGGVTGMLGGIPGHIAVMHTDDANSKETQFLRRRCFNCRTTDPPSWRRSTLNTGKIVSRG